MELPSKLNEDHAELARLHSNLRADATKAARMMDKLYRFHSRRLKRAENRGDEASVIKHRKVLDRLEKMHSDTAGHMDHCCSDSTMKNVKAKHRS
jgi:flagellin-specific chaperone FliS